MLLLFELTLDEEIKLDKIDIDFNQFIRFIHQ